MSFTLTQRIKVAIRNDSKLTRSKTSSFHLPTLPSVSFVIQLNVILSLYLLPCRCPKNLFYKLMCAFPFLPDARPNEHKIST